MKKIILYGLAILFFIGMVQECFNSCSGDDSDESKPTTIREAIIANDFEACNRMLENIYNNTVIGEGRRGITGTFNIADEYIPKAIQVLKAEASYLMDVQNSDAEKLFMLCFNDISGKLGVFNYGERKTKGLDYDNDQYMSCVTPLNGCLLSILKEALIKENLSFAEKVEKLILINIKEQVKKNGAFEDNDYTYTLDKSAQETAKELINDYKVKNNIK